MTSHQRLGGKCEAHGVARDTTLMGVNNIELLKQFVFFLVCLLLFFVFHNKNEWFLRLFARLHVTDYKWSESHCGKAYLKLTGPKIGK